MKEEEVFPHLDVHDSASERASQAKATNTAYVYQAIYKLKSDKL